MHHNDDDKRNPQSQMPVAFNHYPKIASAGERLNCYYFGEPPHHRTTLSQYPVEALTTTCRRFSEHRKAENIQSEDPSQFFQPFPDPFFPMRVILAGTAILATKKRAPNTAIDQMKRLNLIRRTNLRPLHSRHRWIPLLKDKFPVAQPAIACPEIDSPTVFPTMMWSALCTPCSQGFMLSGRDQGKTATGHILDVAQSKMITDPGFTYTRDHDSGVSLTAR